jgi:hypothetical protein
MIIFLVSSVLIDYQREKKIFINLMKLILRRQLENQEMDFGFSFKNIRNAR